MTEGAVLRESGGLVGRVVGSVEVRKVAVNAGGTRQAEVAVDMAPRALLCGVGAHQRETCSAVIERAGRPVGDRSTVTEGAVLRKSRGLVGRVSRVIEIRGVAIHARRARQAEVVVDVACGALLRAVDSHQRKAGCGMVERGAVPIGCGVAQRTIQREAPCFVGRVSGVVKVCEVAVDAGAAGQPEVVIRVALGARGAGVGASQSETGGSVVKVGYAGPVEN